MLVTIYETNYFRIFLFCKGYAQIEGFHFHETFSHAASLQ